MGVLIGSDSPKTEMLVYHDIIASRLIDSLFFYVTNPQK